MFFWYFGFIFLFFSFLEGSCKVELYSDCQFKGFKHVYTSTTRFVKANDQYSSAKLINCEYQQVILYEHAHFAGKSLKLTGNGDSCFVDNGFENMGKSNTHSHFLSNMSQKWESFSD